MPSVVYNEDCVEGLKRFSDNHFDLAIVDPPYSISIENSGTMFKKFGDTKGWDNELPNKEYWEQLFRVSKNQIVWGGNYFIEYLKNTKCIIWWDKMNGTNMMADGEIAWTSFNKHCKRFQMHHFSNGYDDKIHPTQKPVKLYEWILKEFAQDGNLILDTHLGSGSIRIASQKNGFNFTGVEIDKDYYESQEKRFKDFVSQLRMF
ncbi:MAG: site-specific DNA-methyltransferase [Bacteroidia bacterium]|nr:site-specific DNA-methyltransferase [Bacteroidia bacterium]